MIKKYIAIKHEEEDYELAWHYTPTGFFLKNGHLDDSLEYDDHQLKKRANMFDGIQESVIEYLGDSPDVGRSLLEDNGVLVFDDFDSAVAWREEHMLTQSELDVMLQFAQGRSHKEIEQHLSLTQDEIVKNTESANKKLDARNHTQATVIAVALGLIEPFVGEVLPEVLQAS